MDGEGGRKGRKGRKGRGKGGKGRGGEGRDGGKVYSKRYLQNWKRESVVNRNEHCEMLALVD